MEKAYRKLEQSEMMIEVAQEALALRRESERISGQQLFQQPRALRIVLVSLGAVFIGVALIATVMGAAEWLRTRRSPQAPPAEP